MAAKVSAAALMVPTPLLPGAIVPPPLMVTVPKVALPLSVALVTTNTPLATLSEPFTASVPLLMVVVPV